MQNYETNSQPILYKKTAVVNDLLDVLCFQTEQCALLKFILVTISNFAYIINITYNYKNKY